MTEKSSSEIEIDFISSKEVLVLVPITGEQIKRLYNVSILDCKQICKMRDMVETMKDKIIEDL